MELTCNYAIRVIIHAEHSRHVKGDCLVPESFVVSSQRVVPPRRRTSSIMCLVPPGPSPPSPFQRQMKSSFFGAEARALIEHPTVLALIRIVAVLQRAKLARRDMKRGEPPSPRNSGRAKRPRRNRPTSRGRSAPRTECRARAGRSARVRPPRTGGIAAACAAADAEVARSDVGVRERRGDGARRDRLLVQAESAAFRGPGASIIWPLKSTTFRGAGTFISDMTSRLPLLLRT